MDWDTKLKIFADWKKSNKKFYLRTQDIASLKKGQKIHVNFIDINFDDRI